MSRPTITALALCALTACEAGQDQAPAPRAQAPTEARSQDSSALAAPGASRPSVFRATPQPRERALWRWSQDARGEGVTQLRAQAHVSDAVSLSCTFSHQRARERSSVRCDEGARRDRSKRKVIAEIELPTTGFGEDAALILEGDTLLVAQFSGTSSGASAMAYDVRQGGGLLWKRQLKGIGPIAHSGYRNEVQTTLTGDAQDAVLTVYGKESGGAYVERLSARTGELLSHDTFSLAEVSSHPARALPAPGARLEVEGALKDQDVSYALERSLLQYMKGASEFELTTLSMRAMAEKSARWTSSLDTLPGALLLAPTSEGVVVVSAGKASVRITHVEGRGGKALATHTVTSLGDHSRPCLGGCPVAPGDGARVSFRQAVPAGLSQGLAGSCEAWAYAPRGQGAHELHCEREPGDYVLFFDEDWSLKGVQQNLAERARDRELERVVSWGVKTSGE